MRKFAEAEAKISALSEDQQRSIESIKQADAAVKLAHEKFSALAAENAGLKKFCKDAAFYADYEAELGMERGGFSDALNEIKTPATDAFMAEVRAQGVEMFGQYHNFSEKLFIQKEAQKFAAQLRKGGNQ